MNKELLIKFITRPKVYMTVGAILLVGIIVLVFGQSLDEAKATVQDLWQWTQGF